MKTLLGSFACRRRARVDAVSRFALCIVFLFANAGRSFALDPSAPIKDYLLKTWTTGEGLPQTRVMALCSSKMGYLWLGTDVGIVRFDGLLFTVFNSENTPGLRNSMVLALLEDREGRLWVGLNRGLAAIAGGKATSFVIGKGTVWDSVTRLREDRDGIIWAGTSSGDL
jgi:ligand-binding sensor domain-containing protein